MKPLIEELPQHYQDSPPDAEIQRVLSLLVNQAERDLDFTLEQLFPSTASGWGLALWESAYGIRPEAGQTEAQRRERVLAKVKGTGVTTAKKLLALARCFSEYPAELEELPAEYRFFIWYVGTIGPIGQEAMLREIVDEWKPAHLDWRIRYRWTVPGAAYAGAAMRQADRIIFKGVWATPGGRPEEAPVKLAAQTYFAAYYRQADQLIFGTEDS